MLIRVPIWYQIFLMILCLFVMLVILNIPQYPGPMRIYNPFCSWKSDSSCHVTVDLHSSIITIYCSMVFSSNHL